MRKSIIFILSFLLVATCAAWAVAFQPSNEAYGFSSDDLFGGSSYLGVDTRDVTPDRLADLKLKEEHGVEVTTVDQDAPAGKAGIKEHDVILNLNGTAVESVEQLRRMIREVPPGRVVTLGISRNGQPLTLKAQLADRKTTFAMVAPDGKAFKFAMPAMPAIPAMPALPDRKRSDLFEESFELPEIDAETRIDLRQVQSELARVRPQIALAVGQASRTATKELCKQKQELKKQGQEIQKELLDQQRELQNELRIELKGLSEI